MKPPTARQLEVLRAIERLSVDYPPTLRELGDAIGVTVAAAHDHVAALVARGLMVDAGGRSRALTLTRAGTIAAEPARAGQWPPVLVIEDRRAVLVWGSA